MSTLNTVKVIGLLYADQGKLVEVYIPTYILEGFVRVKRFLGPEYDRANVDSYDLST